MSVSVKKCTMLFAMSLLIATVFADARKQELWLRLDRLGREYQDLFVSRYAIEKQKQAIVEKWNNWKSEAAPLLEELKKMGKSKWDVQQAFENVPKPAGAVDDVNTVINRVWDIDPENLQKRLGSWAAEYGDQAFARWKTFQTDDPKKFELKLDYARRAEEYYEIARAIDPESKSSEKLEKTNKAIRETRKQWLNMLEDIAWPGNNPDFEGPGDPEKLSREALSLLDNLTEWTRPEYDDVHVPVAACVTGTSWYVWKKMPITGEPTQWALDFLVAFEGEKNPDTYYCYYMTFYTRQEKGVKREPPFKYCSSKQYAKFQILRSRVRPMTGDTKGGAAVPSLFGRLALFVLLLLGGLVLSEGLLKEKIPAIAPLFDHVTPYQNAIGITLAGFCILKWIGNTIFCLAPLADLLPALAGAVMGIALASDKLLDPEKRISVPDETDLKGVQKCKARCLLAADRVHGGMLKGKGLFEAAGRQGRIAGIVLLVL